MRLTREATFTGSTRDELVGKWRSTEIECELWLLSLNSGATIARYRTLDKLLNFSLSQLSLYKVVKI